MKLTKRNTGILFLALALLSTQLNAAGRNRPGQNLLPWHSNPCLLVLGGITIGGIILKSIWSSDEKSGDRSKEKNKNKNKSKDKRETLRNHYRGASKGSLVLTATAILRFPHMLSDLLDQEQRSSRTDKANVLILGTGVQDTEAGLELPFVHEIAAVFPTANMDIVDLDSRIEKAVQTTRYRPNLGMGLAKKVVANKENFSRFKDTDSEKHAKAQRSHLQLQKFVPTIPLRLREHPDLRINVETNYFELHKPQKRYDYIIATKSLLYPLISTMTREEKRSLVSKYLNALSDNGRLYIDYQTMYLIEEEEIDASLNGFEMSIIEHMSSYGDASNCKDKTYVDYDYIACLNSDNGRVSTTEDIVVITRTLK